MGIILQEENLLHWTRKVDFQGIFFLKETSEKSPNEFALKAGIEYLNEIRLSVGEGQESIMDDNLTITGRITRP